MTLLTFYKSCLCRLSELIGGIDIDVHGGRVKIVEVKLKGEASISLRRVSAIQMNGNLRS